MAIYLGAIFHLPKVYLTKFKNFALDTILIHKKIKQEYPWLLLYIGVSKESKKIGNYTKLIKTINQLSMYNIGDFLTSGLDNILVFFFLSAEMVAYFSNYLMIVLNLGILVDKVFSGSKASVGNLMAENDKKPSNKYFGSLW